MAEPPKFITIDEVKAKWAEAGESLTTEEALFVSAEEIEPRFNDHSWRELLVAFRAGYEAGRADGELDS